MKKFKRDFFFWVERLQITRKERVVISSLLLVIVCTFVLNTFLKEEYQYSSDRYNEIRKEFETKSAAIESKKIKELEKYSTQYDSVENKANKTSVTEPPVININTAGVQELQKLKGIGETYAQRIVDYRVENGEFKTLDELENVKGIGSKRLEDIRPFIKLK